MSINVPALYNTVVMTKLILMETVEINQLLKDLGSNVNMSDANSNAMLGFIKTLDGSNQWHINNPERLIFAKEPSVYKKLFLKQLGQTDIPDTIVPPVIRIEE